MAVVTTLQEHFVVNANTTDPQHLPTVAASTMGGYAVAWQRNDGAGFPPDAEIYLQIFTARGDRMDPEMQVNERIEGAQTAPHIAPLEDGGYVVVWRDGADLYARVYEWHGVTRGPDIEVTDFVSDGYANVIVLANGNFLVSWESDTGPDGDGFYASLFDPDGNAIERDFLLLGTDAEQGPVTAALDTGGFVLAWHGEDAGTAYVYSQRFDDNGNPIGAASALANPLAFDVQVAALEHGAYVLCWNEPVVPDDYSLFTQLYDASGNAVGVPQEVNGFGGAHVSPSIAGLPDGGYVVAWSTVDVMHYLGGGDVYLQRFDNDGVPVSSDTVHFGGDGLRSIGTPSVAGLADGGYVVSWQAVDYADTPDSFFIFSQRYDADGNALHAILQGDGSNDFLEFSGYTSLMYGGGGNDVYIVNDRTDSIVEYANEGADLVRSEVSFTLSANVENLILNAALDPNVTITGIGNELANVITGDANRNFLDGWVGTDILRGGLGNDSYAVDWMGEAIEVANGGRDTVHAWCNYALGDYIENLNLTGMANFNAGGNSLNNVIGGNSGNNVVNGRDGADLLYGNGGDDAMVGGAGNDILWGGAGRDSFRFDAALGANNVDNIKDFVSVDDAIYLENAIFTRFATTGALSPLSFRSGAGVTTAADANDYIICNTTTGDIFYDQDGSGTAFAAVRFANVAGAGATLVAGDFVVV